jgi:hypothetical protein
MHFDKGLTPLEQLEFNDDHHVIMVVLGALKTEN